MKAIRNVLILIIILLLTGGCAPAKKAENDSQPVGSESEADTSDILSQKTPAFTGEEPIKPYWASKNAGSANELLGDVLFVSIFMEDPETEITPQLENKMSEEVRKAGDWLEDEAKKRGKILKITTGQDDAELKMRYKHPNVITADNGLPYEDILSIMKKLKFGSYSNRLSEKYNTENMAFILHFNKNGRSNAYLSGVAEKTNPELLASDEASESDYLYFDICMVYSMMQCEETAYYVYAHELLHLYGAADLYFSDLYSDDRGENALNMHMERQALIDQGCPDEIMRASEAGKTVGDLTAYLIGWEETVPLKYAYFLYER